jgi:hypothetical protein
MALGRARGQNPEMSRERVIRELIDDLTGLDRAVLIDAYRHLFSANMVASGGRRGRRSLSELDREYPAQGAFEATLNANGGYAFAHDSASEMLEANVELNDELPDDVRRVLATLLDQLVASGEFLPPRPEILEKHRAASSRDAQGRSRDTNAGKKVVWAPYRPVSERGKAQKRDVFAFDPNALDRATLEHERVQNRLAELAAGYGLEPLRVDRGPDVDLAWADREDRTVVEVKTITARNETRQLRLGLGQLLDYHDQLTRVGDDARLILAVDRKPSNDRWPSLLNRLGIRLIWPEIFDSAFVIKDEKAS